MRSISKILQNAVQSRFFVLYLIVVYLTCLVPLRPEILSIRNLVDVAVTAAPLMLLAVGQTFVIVTGGIDLSVTAIVSWASVVGAFALGAMSGIDSTLILVATTALVLAAVGVAAGIVHGLSVAILGMQPLLVTLVSLMALEGLAELVTQSQPIGDLPAAFVDLNYKTLLGIPLPLLVALAVTLWAHFLLRHTVWGRQLCAIGMSTATARVSGVPVSKAIIAAYAASGFMAATATGIYMMRLESGKPGLIGESVLLDCIAAVVIGGAPLAGGRGSMWGSAAAAMFLTLVANGLQLIGTLQIWHIMIVKGLIILLAAGLQSLRTSLSRREGAYVE